MGKKKIVIHKCVICPYSDYDEIRKKAVCAFITSHRHKRAIEDIELISDWCPLEDDEND